MRNAAEYPEIRVKKLREGAVLPARMTDGSVGSDLHAVCDGEIIISPGEAQFIPTGLAAELPSGFGGFIFARSSLGCNFGIVPANCVGVIDSDYRGEIKVCLRNQSAEPFTVHSGDRIAQLVVLPVLLPEWRETETLDSTGRDAGGWGSTGR